MLSASSFTNPTHLNTHTHHAMHCTLPSLPSLSVRSPRAGGRDRAPEPHGLDAREFLRKKLIGKEVTVKMEYTRKIGFVPGQEAAAPTPGQEVGALERGATAVVVCLIA